MESHRREGTHPESHGKILAKLTPGLLLSTSPLSCPSHRPWQWCWEKCLTWGSQALSLVVEHSVPGRWGWQSASPWPPCAPWGGWWLWATPLSMGCLLPSPPFLRLIITGNTIPSPVTSTHTYPLRVSQLLVLSRGKGWNSKCSYQDCLLALYWGKLIM